MKNAKWLSFILIILTTAGCASWLPQGSQKQTGSTVDYLYPDAKSPPQLQQTATYLRPPVKVGIAFVPGGGWGAGIPEAEKLKLLARVKDAFARYPYIGKIEVIPTQYLTAKGGFANLNQVARLFDVEVIALLSYDQVQFNDSNALAFLYWTIVGAYFIHGDQYDIQTMVDASVFDVKSQKLLFRAPGTSQVKGSASMSGFNEKSRTARLEGYNIAVEQLIPQLQQELQNFKERIKTSPDIKVQDKPGYSGGGASGWVTLLIVLMFAWRAKRT
jgi:rhombotail lipoprotein